MKCTKGQCRNKTTTHQEETPGSMGDPVNDIGEKERKGSTCR